PDSPLDEEGHEEDNSVGSRATEHLRGRCFRCANPGNWHRGLALATGRTQTERNGTSPRRPGIRHQLSYMPGCVDAFSGPNRVRLCTSGLLPGAGDPDDHGRCSHRSHWRLPEWCQRPRLAPRLPADMAISQTPNVTLYGSCLRYRPTGYSRSV